MFPTEGVNSESNRETQYVVAEEPTQGDWEEGGSRAVGLSPHSGDLRADIVVDCEPH